MVHYAWKPHTCVQIHASTCHFCLYRGPALRRPVARHHIAIISSFFFTHVGARTTVDVWEVDDKSAQGLSQCTALHCSENCENLRVAAVAGCSLLMLN